MALLQIKKNKLDLFNKNHGYLIKKSKLNHIVWIVGYFSSKFHISFFQY